jgi:hypothetical protein
VESLEGLHHMFGKDPAFRSIEEDSLSNCFVE